MAERVIKPLDVMMMTQNTDIVIGQNMKFNLLTLGVCNKIIKSNTHKMTNAQANTLQLEICLTDWFISSVRHHEQFHAKNIVLQHILKTLLILFHLLEEDEKNDQI
ncbi:unnamed protein product (macronuclear) [Paramecium tetraurelia]|uniref:Uncharacterized protein n=1 Tax=Paramecium tetraurelia TaxID=5888 RepID=A0C3A8_PARTE|nr:uncharacterized protein GSPATT00034754001 [Paramecium tetraurelia]CAK65275.1 unnamed protein product [Paramecium tetraurelia]|eukprot:XP_001432672.1 hypothetical protein (macronuclear) [Paramecium tetraurelia strain d4-2]